MLESLSEVTASMSQSLCVRIGFFVGGHPVILVSLQPLLPKNTTVEFQEPVGVRSWDRTASLLGQGGLLG